MIPLDSPESPVKLVNSFAAYVGKNSNEITEEEELEISTRIENLVDATTYQFTGRRIFNEGYRQVEESAEDATMDDIELPEFEKKPEERILPLDFRIRKKKLDTGLLDRLKIPTMAIPLLPVAALTLSGSSIATKATMMSLGAMLLEMYAAFKDLKNFRSIRKPPTKPPAKKPPVLRRWWDAIKANKYAAAIAEIFRKFYNNNVPQSVRNFLRLMAIDNPISTYREAVRKTLDFFRKWKEWGVTKMDRFLDIVKTGVLKPLYQVFSREMARLLGVLAKSKNLVPPSWLLKSSHVKNWMQNSKVWHSTIQTLSRIKNFKLPTWMTGWLKGFSKLPVIGTIVETLFAGLTHAAIESGAEVDEHGNRTGKNRALDQMEKDLEFSADKGFGGNAWAALSHLGGLSNVVQVSGKLGQITDNAEQITRTRHEDLRRQIPDFQDYMKERSRSNKELGTDQIKMELKDFLKNGKVTQERVDEILNNEGFLELAGEVRRYKLDIEYNSRLLDTMMDNYRYSHSYGYEVDKTRFFHFREWMSKEKDATYGSYRGLASDEHKAIFTRLERLQDHYYRPTINVHKPFLSYFTSDGSEAHEDVDTLSNFFNPMKDLRSFTPGDGAIDMLSEYDVPDIKTFTKELQENHIFETEQEKEFAKTDTAVASVTQEGFEKGVKAAKDTRSAISAIQSANLVYEESLKTELLRQLAAEGLVETAAPMSRDERANLLAGFLKGESSTSTPSTNDDFYELDLFRELRLEREAKDKKHKEDEEVHEKMRKMPGYYDRVPDGDGRVYAVPNLPPVVGSGKKVTRGGRYTFKITTSDGEVVTNELLMRRGLTITDMAGIIKRIKILEQSNHDKERLMNSMKLLQMYISSQPSGGHSEIIYDVKEPIIHE